MALNLFSAQECWESCQHFFLFLDVELNLIAVIVLEKLDLLAELDHRYSEIVELLIKAHFCFFPLLLSLSVLLEVTMCTNILKLITFKVLWFSSIIDVWWICSTFDQGWG